MDDALVAYGSGHSDGMAGLHDGERAGDPTTGADYQVGVVDGQIAAFEQALVAAIRKALDDKKSDGPGI
ncbi:hypothetical protein BJ973_003040 [Actinoplanes tereljensis]|uniref:Uncharacterized protein n=1 Tax=Paractinoplanes tereljensis TaxID=571912 RepID=A0A919NXI8_9ACTN|nr:hypothetical protein [Actinoplanes tereljensis]GIF25766.1 hypothetical protein Ate02nite_84960 [Actinoplanes tereljensis]